MGLFKAIFVVSIVGIAGTGLGGVIVACLGTPTKRALSVLLGFAGGVMLSVVAFDLIPEAFELGGTFITLMGFVLGCVATMAIDFLVPHMHFLTGECDSPSSSKLVKTACVVFIGIALHNIPEGLAVGAGLSSGSHIGVQIALVIMLHNIPEGIAIAGPLKALGRSPASIIWIASQAGAPTLIGGIIGVILGGVSPLFLAASIAFAAGAMLFVTFDELIPNSCEMALNHSGTIGAVAGVLINLLLSRTLGG